MFIPEKVKKEKKMSSSTSHLPEYDPTKRWLDRYIHLHEWGDVFGAPFFDPSAAFSGFIAGVTARSVIVLTDKKGWTAPIVKSRRVQQMPDKRALHSRINRRGMFYACLFLFYIPVHRVAQWEAFDRNVTKERVKITLYCIVFASLAARLVVNVWSNVAEAAAEHGLSKKFAYKYLTRHESLPGIFTLFVSQPPLLTSLFYHGSTLFLFESLRRFLKGPESEAESQEQLRRPLFVIKNAVQNGVLASACAVTSSAVTILAHRPYYKNELTRPTALSHPVKFIFKREALMVGLTYGLFSALQPIFSPHHARCGFGY